MYSAIEASFSNSSDDGNLKYIYYSYAVKRETLNDLIESESINLEMQHILMILFYLFVRI